MADLWVMNSQKWLNSTYAAVSGVPRVVEDGITGWGTMYALTRALQHELGITALSDTFGPTTQTTYSSKVGSVSSATKPKIIGILQCALWCKGYTGGTTIGAWDEVIAASIGNVRNDVGLMPGVRVDVKLMKSLLTLDAYVRVGDGTELVRAGQQWLNSRYTNRADYYIVPCDGRFTRDVQRGLMLAIQYELNMVDGVANGNFGPGTQTGLREHGRISSGTTEGSKKFVSLFQLALAFNGSTVPRTGTFDAATRSATLAFQNFLEITSTGAGDFDTWAALLVSTGNPDRPVTGFDTTTALTPTFAAARYDDGFRVVGRYLTVTEKSIVPGELDTLFAAGLKLVPIFQNFNNGPQYFTRALGLDHGRQAAIRARQLGLRGGVTIFFAVDYDAFETEIDALLVPYFEGVRDGLAHSVSQIYRVGVYATRNIAAGVAKRGLASAIWVSGMSTGYSGNLGYPMPAGWWYNQIQELKSINIDRNAVSSHAQPTGRDLVMRVPDQDEGTRALHWRLVETQMLAETALKSQNQGVFSNNMANTLVFSFLMSDKYRYGPFLIYTPWPEDRPGMPSAPLSRAREQYFAAAGAVSNLIPQYAGDLEHLAVVTQGLNYWPSDAGRDVVGLSDLGGWALDTVQLWANFCKFQQGEGVTKFVEKNLGGTDSTTSEFTMVDLISDADGFLIGVETRLQTSFPDSFAALLVRLPEPADRIAEFLHRRFDRDGVTLRQSIIGNIESLWHGKIWPEIPREGFQEGQVDPTSDQLTEFAKACADTLLTRAGIS
jgi:peptidoglycan hydrolase-like protein with peptidoglycan-binding domain